MKETNPLALRLGYKFFWNVFTQPKYFTNDYLLNIKIQQFLYLIFYKKFLLILLNYTIYKYHDNIIVIFVVYITTLYLRQIRKKILVKKIKKDIIIKQHKNNNNSKTRLHKIVNTPVIVIKVIKRANIQITNKKSRTKKINAITKKYLNTPILKFIYYKILLNKFIIENTLSAITHQPTKIFFTTHISLFTTHKRLLLSNYQIYHSLRFIRHNKYFIDLVNIVGFNLYFKQHNLNSLLNFIINELHRTKRHYRFLNTLQKIILTFSKLDEKLCLFTNFKIVITGPINKHGRTKSFKFEISGLNLQTFCSPITYNINYCITKFGTLGIRLWVS